MQIIEFTLCFILNLRFSSLISPFLHEKQCCIENEYLNSQMCRKDFLSPVPDYIRPNSSCSVCSKWEARSPAVAPPEHWVKMEKGAQPSLSKSPPETIVQQPDSLKLKPLIWAVQWMKRIIMGSYEEFKTLAEAAFAKMIVKPREQEVPDSEAPEFTLLVDLWSIPENFSTSTLRILKQL